MNTRTHDVDNFNAVPPPLKPRHYKPNDIEFSANFRIPISKKWEYKIMSAAGSESVSVSHSLLFVKFWRRSAFESRRYYRSNN